MTRAFTFFVAGWCGSAGVVEIAQHSYGYGLFNLAFATVAGLIAWRDA